MLDNILFFNPLGKGIVAQIYQNICKINCLSLTIIKAQWEEDLDLQFEEDNWDLLLSRVHSSSICASHVFSLKFDIVCIIIK